MIGSVKTTKSHPDCLFINKHNNRFIMEECTTQQTSLGKKLKSDISDCLDESQTKIPVQNIEKIIFVTQMVKYLMTIYLSKRNIYYR